MIDFSKVIKSSKDWRPDGNGIATKWDNPHPKTSKRPSFGPALHKAHETGATKMFSAMSIEIQVYLSNFYKQYKRTYVDKVCTMVVPIIKETKEMLFVRKAEGKSNGGLYMFPGGKVDNSDMTPIYSIGVADVCAARELKEEVGIEIDTFKLLYLCNFSAQIPNNKGFEQEPEQIYLGIVYLAPLDFRPEVTLELGELDEYRWLDIFSAKKLADPKEYSPFPAGIVPARAILEIGKLADSKIRQLQRMFEAY